MTVLKSKSKSKSLNFKSYQALVSCYPYL